MGRPSTLSPASYSCGAPCASGPDLLCGACVCIRCPGARAPGSTHYDYAVYERATRKPYDLQARRMIPRTLLRPPAPTTDPHIAHLTTYPPQSPRRRTPEATGPKLGAPHIADPPTRISTPKPLGTIARAYPLGTDPRAASHRHTPRPPAQTRARTQKRATGARTPTHARIQAHQPPTE